jgi:RNA polymerase sigma factor (sigma-70 family)
MSTAIAVLPNAMEEWTQDQRDSLLVIAKRTLAGYGKYQFSREFIARHVDDFVQDALLQAWVSQQDPEAEALRVYNPAGFVSFRVVQLALDKAKGERRRLERAAPERVEADEPSAFQTAAERVSDPVRVDEAHELMEHLEATKLAMAQLPERQRVAFVKCQLEGRSQAEVASELSKGSQRSVSRKAVERLVANARVGLSVAFAKVASGAFCEEQRQLLELVEEGLATPQQEQQARAHLKDCSQCTQVRAFARLERDAGLAARKLPGLDTPASTTAGVGLLDSLQQLTNTVGERARNLAGWVSSNKPLRSSS